LTIDRNHYFRTQIDNIFVTASWFEQVKSIAGISGVSQVWAERPEWYIWAKAAPGVYGLVLEDTDIIGSRDEAWYAGQFTLKCYPYPKQPVYKSFSTEEQQTVTGSLFDHTNTPQLETKARIPATFFTVGGITLMVKEDGNESLLTFESLDRLMVNAKRPPPEKDSQVVPDDGEGHAVRRVPGWQTGWPFFDSFVSLFAFYRKQHPSFIAATQSPGMEQWVDESGGAECRKSQRVRHLSFSLMFCEPSASEPMVETIWRSHLEADEKILFERYLHQPCDPKLAFDAGSSFPINPRWWELAKAQYPSEMATTCGCKDHLHPSCELLNSLH
jgi:hypothetical protein